MLYETYFPTSPSEVFVTQSPKTRSPRAAPTDKARPRQRTTTARFGSSKRESHDASDFYDRFGAPILSQDEHVEPCPIVDAFLCQDSRALPQIPDNSIALMVTSPPYFAGKEYEADLGENGVPASYLEYLTMLRNVFAESLRTLEPGGRMAVNVANLGRRPYRSLSADVIRIVQDDLGMLLRGEIVWVKAAGANGSCAWGSYGSAANPVLRDVTERVIVASKGRFDRAPNRKKRAVLGLPHEDTIDKDEFRALTLDTWHIAPESAKRVGHPAPFPVDLPRKLIELYTFKDDVILDPFGGSGTVALAARTTGRRFICVDTSPEYCELAAERLAALTV
ncbi:MAG: site-specific DNA-methyltransferase [Acidimicrobiia bacterium]|nr:site-specific DNA-methyltransferase [Acidimicrobiia bacterium]